MITEEQFKDTADLIGCPVSCIKAVYKVEANGSGYLDDGSVKGQHDSQDRVKILFEGHRFWKVLAKAGVPENKLVGAAGKFPNVLYKKWDKHQYKGGAAEWERVSQAYLVCDLLGIDRGLALEAASYGAFQIMGENHALCGYDNAHEMLAAFNSGGEAEQLQAFVRFVKAKGLDVWLRLKNWAKFAMGYNGTGYRENSYDIKLYLADKKFAA